MHMAWSNLFVGREESNSNKVQHCVSGKNEIDMYLNNLSLFWSSNPIIWIIVEQALYYYTIYWEVSEIIVMIKEPCKRENTGLSLHKTNAHSFNSIFLLNILGNQKQVNWSWS